LFIRAAQKVLGDTNLAFIKSNCLYLFSVLTYLGEKEKSLSDLVAVINNITE